MVVVFVCVLEDVDGIVCEVVVIGIVDLKLFDLVFVLLFYVEYVSVFVCVVVLCGFCELCVFVSEVFVLYVL